MQPATPANEQPRFIIDESVEDVVATRLRTLERRINEKPAAFQSALAALGDLATEHTIEIDKRDDRQTTLKRGVKDMITEFFSQRYDIEMSFDDATEGALAEDTKHKEILAEMRSKKPEYVRTGKMGSFNRPNEQAVPAREQLRRYRLEFYIGRVAAAQASQSATAASKAKLRSTG